MVCHRKILGVLELGKPFLDRLKQVPSVPPPHPFDSSFRLAANELPTDSCIVKWMLTFARRSRGSLEWGIYGKKQATRHVVFSLKGPRTSVRRASTLSHQHTLFPKNEILLPAPASPLTVAYYWDTAVPTPSQLREAERFFNRPSPTLLYSSNEFRNVKISSLPEVAFLGRSNVGKSSLLNTLMGRNICHTSKKPGRTRSMNFFAVGGEDGMGNPGKVVLLDMPGYGKGSREEWGKEIMKYLVGRKQLKRAFLLIDAEHGIKRNDKELLELLRQNAVSHQVVISKADRIVMSGPRTPNDQQLQVRSENLRKICEDIRRDIQPSDSDMPVALGELIACSAEKSINGKRLGVNHLRWAVLAATATHSPERTASTKLLTHAQSGQSNTNQDRNRPPP